MKTKSMMMLGGAMLMPMASNALCKPKKPNVLFVLCDDMGYGDLGCYGQKLIRTPHLDNMAREGMRFTQAYSGSPVSAPSRAALMTGQHTGHCEIRGNKEYRQGTVQYGVHTDFAVSGQHPLDTAHVVLPEIMKRNGYNTAQFGKWAGGYEGSISTPDKRGVDEYYGYICQFIAHQYYPNFMNRFSRSKGDTATIRVVLEENIKYSMSGDDYLNRPQYTADLIHQEAMEWLDKQDGKTPFYGLLTYTLPHAELVQPDDSILQEYKQKFIEDKTYGGDPYSRYNAIAHTHAQFAGMITRLDAYMGDIFAKLKEKGLDENTIVIFSSDNGPHQEGGADPAFFNRDGLLRGLKRQTHEGGIRVPFIVRWPGKVKAGTVNNLPVAFWDVMPTLCDLAGDKSFPEAYLNPNKENDCFDGISFKNTLLGKNKRQKRHEYLYWEFNETNQIAVRKDDWKLIVKGGVCHLYNLATDLHEDTDIATQHPEVVEELKAIIRKEHRDSPHFHVTLPQ